MMRKRSSRLFADKDSDFACNTRKFANKIVQDPQRYMLGADDAQRIVGVVDAFRAALHANGNPALRNRQSTFLKNAARAEAEAVLRPYASVIRANKKISAIDKMVIRIEERPARMHKRPCPTTRPLLGLARGNDSSATGGGVHRIEFAFQQGSTLGAPRPAGAARIELFLELFEPNTPLPAFADDQAYLRSIYVGSFSRSPMRVKYPMPRREMVAVYWARWANHANETGPMSRSLCAGLVGWNTAMEMLTRPTVMEVKQLEGRQAQQAAYLTAPEAQHQPQLPAPAAQLDERRLLEGRKVTVETIREETITRLPEVA